VLYLSVTESTLVRPVVTTQCCYDSVCPPIEFFISQSKLSSKSVIKEQSHFPPRLKYVALCTLINYTYDTTILQPFFQDYPGARRNLLLDFTVQGKVTEAHTRAHCDFIFFTIQILLLTYTDTPAGPLGATLSGLISDSPPCPHFTPYAFPAATLPIYPGLGQAPNMLACIPSQWLEMEMVQMHTLIA